MNTFSFENCTFAVRDDIGQAYRAFWQRLAKAGSWWTGEQRIAIAAESRAALECDWCKERKTHLSPYPSPQAAPNPGNIHQRTEDSSSSLSPSLSELAVDAVHRIITDQSRITQRYVDDCEAQGLRKGAYVELVGLVVATFSIDEFHRALGLPLEPLPDPVDGPITEYEPQHLSEDIGFVPTIPLEGAVGNEADLWPSGRTANVMRALTLVPDALRDWEQLGRAQYLSFKQMENMGQEKERSLNRMQIEMIAGRVSSINECFY